VAIAEAWRLDGRDPRGRLADVLVWPKTLRITPAMEAGPIGFGKFVKTRRYGLPAIFASQVVNPHLVMVGMNLVHS
jgi:hypothetical protein